MTPQRFKQAEVSNNKHARYPKLTIVGVKIKIKMKCFR